MGATDRPAVLLGLAKSAVGLVATCLPARYWSRLHSRGMPTFPVMSPLLTVCVAIYFGLPMIFRHLLLSASEAQGAAPAAAGRLSRAADPEAVVALTQTLSLMGAFGVIFTPMGFSLSYLAASGGARLLAAYVGDPGGDPLLACADLVRRRMSSAIAARRCANAMHRQFGPEEPDEIADPRELGYSDADVIVVACRPKDGWTTGAVIWSGRQYYYVLESGLRRVGERVRILYPLRRKGTFDIVRKAIPYVIPQGRGTQEPLSTS